MAANRGTGHCWTCPWQSARRMSLTCVRVFPGWWSCSGRGNIRMSSPTLYTLCPGTLQTFDAAYGRPAENKWAGVMRTSDMCRMWNAERWPQTMHFHTCPSCSMRTGYAVSRPAPSRTIVFAISRWPSRSAWSRATFPSWPLQINTRDYDYLQWHRWQIRTHKA